MTFFGTLSAVEVEVGVCAARDYSSERSFLFPKTVPDYTVGKLKAIWYWVTQMAFIVCDYRLADGWVANPYVG